MNPFFSTFDTPHGIPKFEQIEASHYVSAMREGMRIQKEEIEQIVKNSEKPTFENTILALENSGVLLNQVLSVFYNLNSAHTNDTLQQIAQEMAPELAAHGDDIALNSALFSRVKKVYDQRENLSLDDESLRLLEKKYNLSEKFRIQYCKLLYRIKMKESNSKTNNIKI